VVLGVLLPALLSRPAMLTTYPMQPYMRRRWQFAYTTFAFAGASFVYTAAITLLKPTHGFSEHAERGLGGAAALIVFLLAINHLPPLLADRQGRLAAALLRAAGAILGGFFLGIFFAVDDIAAKANWSLSVRETICLLTLDVAVVLLCLWHGPAPDDRLTMFRLRRRLKRWRRKHLRAIRASAKDSS
jgi:hypothetical protein